MGGKHIAKLTKLLPFLNPKPGPWHRDQLKPLYQRWLEELANRWLWHDLVRQVAQRASVAARQEGQEVSAALQWPRPTPRLKFTPTSHTDSPFFGGTNFSAHVRAHFHIKML